MGESSSKIRVLPSIPQACDASQAALSEDTSKTKQSIKECKARRRLALAGSEKQDKDKATQLEEAPSQEAATSQEPLPELSQSALSEGLQRHLPVLIDQILDPVGGSNHRLAIRPSLRKVPMSSLTDRSKTTVGICTEKHWMMTQKTWADFRRRVLADTLK